MVRKTKKILITTEEHEIFIVRRGAEKTYSGFCETCGEEVEMLMLDQSVARSGKRPRELIRQIEAGAIHTTETENLHLLICLSSLERFLQAKAL